MNSKKSNKINTHIDKEPEVRITIRTTKPKKELLAKKAASANKSMNAFLIDTALESETSCKNVAFQQAQRLVQLQRQIDDIEDQFLKAHLRKECAKVWHGFASLMNVENTRTILH